MTPCKACLYKRTHTHTHTHIYTHDFEIHGWCMVRWSRNCVRCMDAIIERHFAIREKTTFPPSPDLPSDRSPFPAGARGNSRKSTERYAPRATLGRDKPQDDVLCSASLWVSPREGKYVSAREISRIMRAQCANGTPVDSARPIQGIQSEVVGRLINYQIEVNGGKRNCSPMLDDELWLFLNSEL